MAAASHANINREKRRSDFRFSARFRKSQGDFSFVTVRFCPREGAISCKDWQQITRSVSAVAASAELERHIRRFETYQSKRVRPQQSGVLEMVYAAQVRYERRLVAVTNNPDAPMLAVEYVDALRPCYEWEGYHDCPEREAIFAVEYQRAHPHGPFSEYLPLLAAHRWVCAAEGYEYEQRAEGARRSRLAYEQAIATARESGNTLVRLAADALSARARCFSRR